MLCTMIVYMILYSVVRVSYFVMFPHRCECTISIDFTCERVFFFQAEDGIRDLVRSRGLGDVYKRQTAILWRSRRSFRQTAKSSHGSGVKKCWTQAKSRSCLLYTSDAADERSSVDLGGRRIIKKKKIKKVWRRMNNDRNHTSQRTNERNSLTTQIEKRMTE